MFLIYSYIYEKTQLTHVHCRNILTVLKKQIHPSGIKEKEKNKKESLYLN